MNWMIPPAIVALSGTLVLAGVYTYLYVKTREHYLAIWSASWYFYDLRMLFEILSLLYPSVPVYLWINQIMALFSGYFLLRGTHVFSGRRMSRWWTYGLFLGLLWISAGVLFDFSFMPLTFPIFMFLAVSTIWTGIEFFRISEAEGVGTHLTGTVFIIWGLHKADYSFFRNLPVLGFWGYLLGAILSFTAAVGLLLFYLRKSEARFRLLAENAQDGIFRYRYLPTPGFEYVSPSCHRISGYTPHDHYADPEIIGKVVHPQDKPRLAAAMREGTKTPVVARCLRKDGGWSWIEFQIVPILDKQGALTAVEGIARDVSERRQTDETINRLAYYDPLTGLANRILFSDRFKYALAQAHRKKQHLGLLFFDLDDFKVVNDTLGHAAGDKLLQEVTQRLTGTLWEDDTLARLGGDEFAVLLPEILRPEDAGTVAEKVKSCLENPLYIDDQELRVTASIGIALYPGDGTDPATLLKNADTAMYQAKDLGKNGYAFYAPQLSTRVLQKVAYESSLRYAIENKELEVWYQPQMNLATGQISGVEALLRWRHPAMGLISAAEFIPVAEESGLILPLGEWVLRTAASQVRKWQNKGLHPVRVAVNLSGRQFRQADLQGVILRILEETGLEPSLLELEITESVAMENMDRTLVVLQDLSARGISISVDDFGTGYSSLNYLKRFPLQKIKIDQSFVTGLPDDQGDAAIVKGIILLAHSLNLEVVAEGVEKPEQKEFLFRRRCDGMQGYLLSQPVPASVLEKMLKKLS